MTGRCGNDPRTVLTEGDRQAVEEFRQFLAVRAQLRADFARLLLDEDGRLQPCHLAEPEALLDRLLEVVSPVLAAARGMTVLR